MRWSNGRRVALTVIFLALFVHTGACGRDADDGAEEARAIEMSFVVSEAFLEVEDKVLLELENAESLAFMLDSIQWRSADTTVAVIRPDGGAVTGVGEGATHIWARLGADSVSAIVVVQPRTEMFVLSPRDVFFDAVGDLANFELLSIGRDPLPEGDLTQFCRSTDTTVVTVNAGSTIGSVGNGSAYVRCEIAWTKDSVLVEVQQRAVRIAILKSRIRPIGVERDSIVLDIATIDRLGSPQFDVTPTWRSLNARIVQIDRETGVASGVSLGSARIVAEYEGLADTLSLEVREDAEAEAVSTLPPATVIGLDQDFAPADDTEVTSDFYYDEYAERDIADTGVARTGPALQLEDERITRIITAQDTSAVADETPGRGTMVAAVVGIADHRVDFGTGAEKTAGPVFGAEFDVPLARLLSVRGQVLSGRLSAGASGIEDRTLTDFGFALSYGALPWANIEIGSGVRSYTTAISTQRWSSISTGGRAHLDALDGLVRGHVNFAFVPLVSVSGMQSPSLGLQGGAGLDFRQGRFRAGLRYELERFSFPARFGIQRIEQYAILRFRVGFALGGN